jgi:hypothetical protein
MNGSIGILNVGAGDTKIVFDKDNPADCIRAARIVKDMLKRGYALLIEVERNGKKVFQRALEFREDTCEYIIADFDPVTAEKADREEAENEQTAEAASSAPGGKTEPPMPRGRRRAIHASSTRAVAVSRSAGG